jgi:predicted short-subunit dehydrogenase-like oxidoreductase (DUF2520 family)
LTSQQYKAWFVFRACLLVPEFRAAPKIYMASSHLLLLPGIRPAMLPPMPAKPTVAIIGPGRLGSALALQLARTGYRISEIVSRTPASARQVRALTQTLKARSSHRQNANLEAGLIWLCVPDREIAVLARDLAALKIWRGKTVFHSSGALDSDTLSPLRKRGAKVASVHPLMTFVRGAVPTMKGITFALEGDPQAVRLARQVVHDLGARNFLIRKQDKAAYHAWGAFTSPLLVAALVTAEQVARSAGLKTAQARRMMLPIVCQTFVNYAALGPAGSFSGPLVRGDAEIVRKHLQALKKTPEARAVYIALARSALRHLPVENRRQLERVLKA